jgi:2-isopropylmalate synthase
VGVRAPDGAELTGSFTGDGPVDAIFRAINAATGSDARLREFRVDAVTGGQDALGETSVVLELGGITGSGQGVSTDILEAAGRAYVRALSNAIRKEELRDVSPPQNGGEATVTAGAPKEVPVRAP